MAAKKASGVAALLTAVGEDAALPAEARTMLNYLGEQIARLDAEIAGIDARLMAQHKANAVSCLLAESPASGRSPRSIWCCGQIPRSSAPADTSPPGSV